MPKDNHTKSRPAPRTRTSGWAEARKSRIGTVVIMGVTAVIILAVTYVVNRPTANGGGLTQVVLSGRPSGPPPKVGETAPDFTATTVDGGKITLSKLHGRPVWLTFGASWCQPCRAEAPDIQAAYEKHRAQGLVVIAISIREDASAVRDYAKRVGLTFPKIADPNTRIASTYRVLGIPSQFFIDRGGVLRVLKAGSVDPPAIEADLLEVSGDTANRQAN